MVIASFTHRNGAALHPAPRRPAASLTSLLGQRPRQRPQEDPNEPLAAVLARALGVPYEAPEIAALRTLLGPDAWERIEDSSEAEQAVQRWLHNRTIDKTAAAKALAAVLAYEFDVPQVGEARCQGSWEAMTDAQQISDQPKAAPEQPRKSSGYRRLQRRHHELISERDTLLAENAALTYQQRELQADIDRLLAEHQRIVANVKSGATPPWFESANQVLAQLAANPEPRALQIITAAIAGLQQRLAQIIMRVTP